MQSEVDGGMVMAYELKKPFCAVRQMALLMDFEKNDVSELEDLRSQLVEMSDKALRQIEDLAKISRLEQGMFEMEPVCVRAICDEVVGDVREKFGLRTDAIRTEYTNRARLVTANSELLRSIVYNFCTNAVRCSVESVKSVISLKENRGFVQLMVRDFGPALPKEVFEELKSGEIKKPLAIAMRPGSSGLGIYIANRFSRYMNLEMRATRHRDGASFMLKLPKSQQARLF